MAEGGQEKTPVAKPGEMRCIDMRGGLFPAALQVARNGCADPCIVSYASINCIRYNGYFLSRLCGTPTNGRGL